MMTVKYELIIYAGKKILSAYDVTGNKAISIDGNTSCSSSEINYFYDCLLDYYNVDDLEEIDAGVRIINGGISEKCFRVFSEKFGKLTEFSMWRVEELLPIVLLEHNRIDKKQTINVSICGESYQVSTDTAFAFSVAATSENADLVLKLEELAILNHFNGTHFHGDEEETSRLQRMIAELEVKYNSADENARIYYQECCNLKKQLDAIKIGLELFVGNADIRQEVARYLPNSIKYEAFQIKTEYDPENTAMKVAIQNSASIQSYIFSVPASVDGSYTKEKFQEDLYKKIAKAIQMMNENQNYNKLKNSSLSSLKKGEAFTFGNYKGNDLKWIVLRKSETSLYAICNRVVEERKYSAGYISWKASELRKWLNNDFFNQAFSKSEKTFITKVNEDNVTLPSAEEAELLMDVDERKYETSWWLKEGDRIFPEEIPLYVYDDVEPVCLEKYGVRPAITITF